MARFVVAPVLLILGRHVGSSARVRNDNGFELREPRKEKVSPTPEERHKYIHDGKEYNRPPNLFDVGGGELKLLPEVLSSLSFEPRDFKDDGTTAEQKALRDSRPWGRLHVDGWPAPIQYLRSHFGGPPMEGMQPMVLADPLDACVPLRNADSIGSAVLIVTRGTCTYTTKARNAQEASASALLIVNNEGGLLHPPGPDGMDLDIFSAMIPQPEGTALIETMRNNDPVQGALVPMNCNKHVGIGDMNQQCLAAVKADRDLVDRLALGGFVHLPGGEKFEYLLAGFGVKAPSRELKLDGSPNPSSTACHPATKEAAAAAVGKAVLATRGGCSFLDKAESVGAAGPSGRVGALIVTNNETSLFHMGASPRWRGATVSFPMVLVSDVAGHALANLPADAPIRFSPSKDVTMAAWDEIGRLKEASAWPTDAKELQFMYETLVAENAAFPDRVSAVRAAFSRVSGGEDKGEAGGAAEKGGKNDKRLDAVNPAVASATI